MTLVLGSGRGVGVGEGVLVTVVLVGETPGTGGLFLPTWKNAIRPKAIIEKIRKGLVIVVFYQNHLPFDQTSRAGVG